MKRFKTKCIKAQIDLTGREHLLTIECTDENAGMFGSKIAKDQFEKVESVLSKRYIKLPFGVRILL